MQDLPENLIQLQLEKTKRTQEKSGVEYWRARDLVAVLGYAEWENFQAAIARAMAACESSGVTISQQFRETTKLVMTGSGAKRNLIDYFLTRYACYLIVMNADSSKPEIGFAQTYFAIQTRRQEIADSLTDDEKRLQLRERVKDANRKLAGVAQKAGVQKFGIFNDAGYKGLYAGLGVRDIKRKKGIAESDDLLDCAGRTELAANEFRITQTEQKLVRERIRGEQAATNTHYEVGSAVRRTIVQIGGTMPEDLPTQPSIKKLGQKSKKLAASKPSVDPPK